LPGVENKSFAEYWNYETPLPDDARQGCDTVGAVLRTVEGHFAVACSTGGSAPSLLGRVGDTPIIGAGFFAGPRGAVTVTGLGEHIVRHLLAFTVYRWIAEGMPLAEALDQGLALFPDEVDVGIIAVSASEAGTCSNRSMPAAIIESA
jgi:L-asparaginase / beta-aspartyl-peptidase